MAGIFSKPKMPEIPPPPPAVDNSAAEARDNAAREERMRRSMAGRASTMLTGGQGLEGEAPSARKVLTGG